MAGLIDVRDLTDEQVEAVERLVKLFRQKAGRARKEKTGPDVTAEEEFTLSSYSSDVIGGKLTRKEIYEDL